MPISLPSVTICCFDSRFPELAEYSLYRSIEIAGVSFGDCVLFTDPCHSNFVRNYDFPLRVVPIAGIKSALDYSRFVIRDLPDHIHTDHVLITQWDSFILNASAWTQEFLALDYVGAPWPWLQPPHNVGNGGFSLRSRKLLNAAREAITVVEENEDVLIGIRNRSVLENRYALKFPDEKTAARFSFERGGPDEISFGFHGLFNFRHALAADDLARYMEAIPPVLALSTEALELIVDLWNCGQRRSAKLLLGKRLQANSDDVAAREIERQIEQLESPFQIRQTPAHDGFNVDVLSLMPPGLSRIVEVGSSSGALAGAYREKYPDVEYIGVEIDANYASQSQRRCSRVIHGDIEKMSDDELRSLAPAECWVFADVIEHLYNPWLLLRRLRNILRPSDCIVACIPNAQHWSVIARLASGNFWYEDMGLLDRTHIRFFTRTTLLKMFNDCGFNISGSVLRFHPQNKIGGEAISAIQNLARVLGSDPAVSAQDTTVYQYVVRAVPI